MGRLFLKILLLLFVLAAIDSLLFSYLHLPYLWGYYYESEKCLEQNTMSYNTILLGSSRTGRQIDPLLFDSLNSNTHTLNMGMDGASITEVYYLFNHILTSNNNRQPRYILVDLCDIDLLKYANLHTIRKKYYYTPQVYYNSAVTVAQSAYPLDLKFKVIVFHTITFLESLLKFNEFESVVNFKSRKLNSAYDCDKLYEPLVIKHNDTSYVEFEGERILNPNAHFMQHPEELDTLKQHVSTLLHDTALNGQKFSSCYYRLVKNMLENGRQHGIKVIFILPPKLTELQYQTVLPIFNKLDASNKISLADPNLYPEFYSLKYAFDLGHVDKEGARIYTEKLSKQFQQIESSSNLGDDRR